MLNRSLKTGALALLTSGINKFSKRLRVQFDWAGPGRGRTGSRRFQVFAKAKSSGSFARELGRKLRELASQQSEGRLLSPQNSGKPWPSSASAAIQAA